MEDEQAAWDDEEAENFILERDAVNDNPYDADYEVKWSGDKELIMIVDTLLENVWIERRVDDTIIFLYVKSVL
jgi:hypothetical protein